MEHRRDLEEILLAGLADDEKQHVTDMISQESKAKLRRLRSRTDEDEDFFEAS
jgi:hypothetical protein